VVARFKGQIAVAQGKAGDPVIDALALDYRGQVATASDETDAPYGHGYSERDLVDAQIAAEAEALAGPPVGANSHGGPVFDPVRMRKAQRFTEVARGHRTPLRVPEVAFRKQKGDNWQAKTWGKYDRIMALLEAWLRERQSGAAIEGVDRKAAGAFIGETLEAQGWTAKTMNSYLSCLRQYWRWMIKRGYAQSNPWDNQQLEAPRQKEATKERPFTTEEMRKLIYGQPPQPYLSDLMRLAALTGARLGALVEIRVRDCQDGVFMIPPQKSEEGPRRVPIHSALRGGAKERRGRLAFS